MRYLFIFLILIGHLLPAQNLVVNGSFETNAGNDITVLGCPTFSAGSMPTWTRSHGTPDLLFGAAPDGNSFLRMWAKGNPVSGEGVYNLLATQVQDRQSYTLCFTYKTTAHPGTIVFELVNSNPLNGSVCGDPPGALTSQVIGTVAFPQATWLQASIAFTAVGNWSYLRIYPTSNYIAGVNDLPNLYIDRISISPCSGSLFMTDNQNYDVSQGFYQRYYITAGSTALIPNSSIMIVNPNRSTVFRGNTNGFVDLIDDFNATPNPDYYFEAQLGPCGCPADDILLRMGETSVEMSHDLMGETEADPLITWNESTGIFQIRHATEIASFVVYDLSGRMLMQSNSSGNTTEIDSELFPAGVYLIKIVDVNGRTFGKRIINPR